MNKIITYLKPHNTNNRPKGTSLLKTNFLKNNLQHKHDVLAGAPIDKANGKFTFIC